MYIPWQASPLKYTMLALSSTGPTKVFIITLNFLGADSSPLQFGHF